MSTYNVFSAAARLGVRKVVWGSSETILGLPFSADSPPPYLPLDTEAPDRPGWSYALAKQMGEQMADSFVRWRPEMSIASLRFSNVCAEDDYAELAAAQARPTTRRFNLWSYVDARDAGQACRLAVEADFSGHQRMIIAAEDTVLHTPSLDLAHEHFPGVSIRNLSGDAISRARSGFTILPLLGCLSSGVILGCNLAHGRSGVHRPLQRGAAPITHPGARG